MDEHHASVPPNKNLRESALVSIEDAINALDMRRGAKFASTFGKFKGEILEEMGRSAEAIYTYKAALEHADTPQFKAEIQRQLDAVVQLPSNPK